MARLSEDERRERQRNAMRRYRERIGRERVNEWAREYRARNIERVRERNRRDT